MLAGSAGQDVFGVLGLDLAAKARGRGVGVG